MKKKYLFIFIGILTNLLIGTSSFAQQEIESILNSSEPDSVKFSSVISLFKEFNSSGQFYKTIQAGEKIFQKNPEISHKRSASAINSAIGVAYYYKGNFAKALEYYFKTLKIREDLNDIPAQGAVLNNIGVAYQDMKNFPMAKQYLFQGLQKRQQFGDSLGIGRSYNNIGLLYYTEGTLNDSAKKEQLFDSAMYFLNTSLEIVKLLNSEYDVSYTIGNIGNVLKDRGKKREAIKYYEISLKMQEKLNDKLEIAVSNIQLGDVHSEINELPKALQHYKEGLKICIELENFENLRYCYLGMSRTYELLGDYKMSLESFKKYTETKDTILNSESNKQIAEMQTIYDTEKKDAEIKLLNKDKEVAESDKKKQKIILYSVILGLLLVIVFSVFIYKNYKQKQVANIQLEKKNTEINHQKKEIEEKNSEMLASIRYAKRIQQAVLKAEKKVTARLPDHFVLFKPKDIVSGDFYWTVEKKEWWFVAAADCTGHGVPGAFLTMLGISYLNEIIAAENFISPYEILNKLRDKIVKELSGTEGETKDGMDISLAAFNVQTNELQWAGANNSFYIISSGNLREIKADKQPVGYFHEAKPFTNHKIHLQKNDSVYIFSDGYADQFGGPKGKKFKYSQFEKLLISIHPKTMDEQKEILNNEIENWKGNLEQVDDICIIGLRV